jgi:ketosteroid isomerase-like protein
MAEQVSDPKLTTLDVKPLGPSAAREIGTFSLKTKGPTPQEVTGKYLVIWEKVGSDWKLAADSLPSPRLRMRVFLTDYRR